MAICEFVRFGATLGLLALATASSVRADDINDYPTVARSEYVFGCLKANGETRQAISQCSCSIDVIASLLPYDRYVTAETVLSMGFPQGDEIAQGTNPYYRTAYALVTRKGSGLEDITSLADERLKGKHLGIVAGTPPATYMAANGLMANAKPYPLMIDTRVDSSAAAMMNDLGSGEIDAAVLWGPMAGYYAKQANPPLHVTPLVNEKSGPQLVYRIGMGVRSADQNWKRVLNRLIAENQPAINKILLDYGVPLLDENDHAITAEMSAKKP